MTSPFMRIPAELRLLIYEYLFDVGYPNGDAQKEYCPGLGNRVKSSGKRKIIAIRNGVKNASSSRPAPAVCSRCGQYMAVASEPAHNNPRPRRSHYRIVERSFGRHCFETTYYLAHEQGYVCAALMRVNRRIYDETRYLIYEHGIFDFGGDVEAVKPFLSDLTPDTRALVKCISLYKRGPWIFYNWSTRNEWQAMCDYLCNHVSVEYLRLVVQARRSSGVMWREREWEPLASRQLSSTDVSLLVEIHHEAVEWVTHLFPLKDLREMEILPDFCAAPAPQTSEMAVYSALSRSVDKGLWEFLREHFRLGF